jgi:hypothetical protein
MSITSLRKLISTKLADGKIDPNDARDILGNVEKDGKYTKAEIAELQRLVAMPRKTFVSKDEFVSLGSADMEFRAEPRKMIQHAVSLASATLDVKSTIPGFSVALGAPELIREEDAAEYGGPDYMARKLSLAMSGGSVEKAGTIEFTYGKKAVKVAVKKGMTSWEVFEKISSQLFRNNGGLLAEGVRPNSTKSTFVLTEM